MPGTIWWQARGGAWRSGRAFVSAIRAWLRRRMIRCRSKGRNGLDGHFVCFRFLVLFPKCSLASSTKAEAISSDEISGSTGACRRSTPRTSHLQNVAPGRSSPRSTFLIPSRSIDDSAPCQPPVSSSDTTVSARRVNSGSAMTGSRSVGRRAGSRVITYVTFRANCWRTPAASIRRRRPPNGGLRVASDHFLSCRDQRKKRDWLLRVLVDEFLAGYGAGSRNKPSSVRAVQKLPNDHQPDYVFLPGLPADDVCWI